MSEYQRANGLQWVDDNLCVVMDTLNGELQAVHVNNQAGVLGHRVVNSLEKCLDYVKGHPWGDRLIIVRLDCIRAFKLPSIGSDAPRHDTHGRE